MKTFFGELRRRNVVRVGVLYAIVGWLVLQVADLAMPRLGIPEWGVTLVIVLVALGFPLALVLAWAFEVTPEGIKRTHEVEHHESITHLTGRKLDFLIIGVLAAALVYVVIDSYVLRERSGSDASGIRPSAPLVSIAVLPFADMSQAKDQEYLTDGISEELLNVLARVEGFKVTGRTSAFAFKGRNEDLRTIGQKLGVDHILEGSVRKQGEFIRVTAQLVKAADGYHLWSETYDRQLGDVFAIQDDIARQVVGSIRRTLGTPSHAGGKSLAGEEAPTQSVEAYTRYLRGQHMLRTRKRADMQASLAEFEQAVALDPRFARAHVGIANALLLLVNYRHREVEDVEQRVSQELERALQLDADLGEAYAMKAQLLYEQVAPPDEQIALLERATTLNPSDSQSLTWLAGTYGDVGRAQEEMRTYARAYAIDPLLPILLQNYALVSHMRGEVTAAQRLVGELEALPSGSSVALRTRAQIARASARFDDWIRWTAALVRQDPDDTGEVEQLFFAYGVLGDLAGARLQSRRLTALAPDSGLELAARARLEAWSGNVGAAVALLRTDRFAGEFDLMMARAEILARHGEHTQALEALLSALPQHRAPRPVISLGPSFFSSPLAVFLFDQVGDSARAQAVAEAAIKFADTTLKPLHGPEQGSSLTVRAKIAAARGDRATMHANLRQLYETGGAVQSFLATDPVMQPYRSDPAVIDLLAKFDARRAEWRTQLAAEGL